MLLILLFTLATSPAIFGQFQLSFVTTAPPSNSFDPNCKDKMDSCWKMPESNCRAPYEQWARDYCPNRCGYCIGPTTPAPACVNKLPNCEAYDKSVCTNPDYVTWAGENCRYFCRMCPQSELDRLDSITTTIRPEDCVDKVDCRQYGTNACSSTFQAWSKDNCANYCGYCTGIPTPPPVCQDRIPNCKAYSPDTCTNPDYKLWVQDNCKQYCGLCIGSPTIPYAPPSPPSPGRRMAHQKRQFQASHHHQGGTHDCWDGSTTDPYCNTPAPTGEVSGSSPSLDKQDGFAGSEFKPHPKPDPDWDNKPSTETPTTTTEKTKTPQTTETQTGRTNATVKPPFATGAQTPVIQTATGSTVSPLTTPSAVTSASNATTQMPGSAIPMSQSLEPSTGTATMQGHNGTTAGPQATGASVSMPQVSVSTNSTAQVPVSLTSATGSPSIQTNTTPAAQTLVTGGIGSTPNVLILSTTGGSPALESTTPGMMTPPLLGSTTTVLAVKTPAPTLSSETPMVSSTSTSSSTTAGTSATTTNSPTPAPSTTSAAKPPTVTAMQTTVSNDTTQAPCVDTVDNCALYGKQACTTEVYKPWAKAHCSRFCGFCTPVTFTPFECRDKLTNCNEFDSGDLCTADAYFAWARENCYAYCGFDPCGNATVTGHS